MAKLFKILAIALFWPHVAMAVDVVVIAPQEGDYQDFGRELAEGAKIATQDINAAGGVLGQQINLIVADDRCDDTFAVSMAQMLSVRKEKPALVVGPFCANKADETTAIYAQGKILQIAPLPQDQPGAAINLSGLRRDQAEAFGEYYRQNLQGQNVALVYASNHRESVDIAAATQQYFAANGLANRLTGYDALNYGKDYELLAREILLNNQVAYVLGESKAVAKLSRELKAQNSQIKIFNERYALKNNYAEILGSNAEGIYYLGLRHFKDSPYFTETLVRLRLQGQEPMGLGVYGFAAVQLWAQMAERAKSVDYARVRQAAQAEYELPWGAEKPMTAKLENHHLYGVYQKVGEEYAQVY